MQETTGNNSASLQSIKRYLSTSSLGPSHKTAMTSISEVLTEAHTVLNTTQHPNMQEVDPEITLKIGDTSQQNENQLTTNLNSQSVHKVHGDHDEEDKEEAPQARGSTPDYNNMSNGDMIKLFMETVTKHKDELKLEIRRGETRIQNLKVSNEDHSKKLTILTSQCQDLEKSLSAADSSIKNLTDKVLLLTNITIRQSALISKLQDKNESNDTRTLKNCLIIKGLMETKPENCKAVVESFFSDKLKLNHPVTIQVAHHISNGKNRPMRVVLQNPQQKGIIYKNVSNLKGVTNEKGKKYQIQDQLPPRASERTIRNKDLMWQNSRKKNTAKHLEMTIKNGQLAINNTPSKKLVHPPSPRDVLKATAEDKIRWAKTKTVTGNVILRGNCYFHGFSLCAGKIETIRDGYYKLREKFADARHIACAYRLPGRNFAVLQDYEDDDEHGAGRALLSMLVAADIFNRAVYVVRFYGGQHIGPAHFQAYVEAAQSAITHDPNNSFCKRNQLPWPTSSSTTTTPVVTAAVTAPLPIRALVAANLPTHSSVTSNDLQHPAPEVRDRLPSGPLKHYPGVWGPHADQTTAQWEDYYHQNHLNSKSSSWGDMTDSPTITSTAAMLSRQMITLSTQQFGNP